MANQTETEGQWSSVFVTASDGLKLYVRHIGDRLSPLTPVICLAGLSRSSLDFETIGAALAARDGRFILALDYRGRGHSDYDPNWKNYDLAVELADIQQIMVALGITRAIFLGTSRGGLLTALMTITRPEAVAGAIINDIGPIIEARGLARIRGYIGKISSPADYASGATMLKQMFGGHFRVLDDAGWLRFAQRSWKQGKKGLVANYDPKLMNTLKDLDFEKPMPDLWPQFGALNCAPLMVIRGLLSDLFSQETAEAMVARHPNARLHLVPEEGHAPLLEDAASINAITDFVAGIG
jgi:pimeloyl-ACP methyl ester carboxylesterase